MKNAGIRIVQWIENNEEAISKITDSPLDALVCLYAASEAVEEKHDKQIKRLKREVKSLRKLVRQSITHVKKMEHNRRVVEGTSAPVIEGWSVSDFPGYQDAVPTALRGPDGEWRLYWMGGPELLSILWPFKPGYDPKPEDFEALGFTVGVA